MIRKSCIWFFVGLVCVSWYFIYFVIFPSTIETRAKNLNLMYYDGKQNKFVFKEGIVLSAWDLYYLQYGTMNK